MALLALLLFLLSEAASEPEVIEVPVEPGQDVTLPCQTGDVIITGADWTRSDLKPPKEILFYSDGNTNSDIEGRVQLVNGELKNRDVSLILKNVRREDVGTYECRVLTAGSGHKKRANSDFKLIKTIRLQMKDPEDQNRDNKDGDNINNGDTDDGNSTPLYVGLVAAGVVLVCLAAVVGLLLVRKSKRQREKKPEPSADEETGDNLL